MYRNNKTCCAIENVFHDNAVALVTNMECIAVIKSMATARIRVKIDIYNMHLLTDIYL